MNATAMKEIPPPLQMLQLISGFWVSRCIYVAAKLGIPDLLPHISLSGLTPNEANQQYQ